MDYTGSMTRMQASNLPSVPCSCGLARNCVYRVDGICKDPQTHKGNGDSACHRMGNRAIYALLELVPNVKLRGASNDYR